MSEHLPTAEIETAQRGSDAEELAFLTASAKVVQFLCVLIVLLVLNPFWNIPLELMIDVRWLRGVLYGIALLYLVIQIRRTVVARRLNRTVEDR